jgi:tight adherence protein C
MMTLTEANMPVVFSVATFFTMLLFFWGVMQYLRLNARKQKLKEKIQQGEPGPQAQLADSASGAESNSGTKPVLDFLGFVGKRVASQKSLEHSGLRLRFLKAGIRALNAPAIFWGARLILALALSIGFFSARVSVLKLFDPRLTVCVCVMLFAAGFVMPDIWLRLRISQRKNRLLAGFPDALDLLVICVEAGMGMDAAINRVAEEIRLTNTVLCDELRLLNLEIRAGKSRPDALRNLALRTDLDEINSFVTLLIQTDKFGTSLAQTLRVYSDSFRTKRFQKAETIAAQLPVKLVFPTVFFIFPSLFIVILGPAAIRIFQTLIHH